ncbi:hypothetical protein ACWENQ_44805 [Nonomuraea sp. NPDC004354]
MAEQSTRERGVWVAITAITMLVSLGLNIAHALVYQPTPDPNAAVKLSTVGHVVLGLLSGFLPVVMAGLMSHAFFSKAPGGVRLIVVIVFLVGMGMSLTAQFELMAPAVGALRAAGTIAVIDVPGLTALFMIERGNRAKRAAEQAAIEARAAARRAAERERQEQAAAARRAEEQAAAERLAAEQRAAAEAAERAAEAERQAAAERAEVERQAAARAESERLAAAEQAAALLAETERLAAAQAAAAEAERAERARAERLAAAQRVEAEQRLAEAERAERARAEREAEEARKEAERQARAEQRAARQARAEQAERGDLTPAQKKEVIRVALEANPEMRSPDAIAAVVAEGGQLSEQRARAILSELRKEAGGALSNVRPLRSTAAV